MSKRDEFQKTMEEHLQLWTARFDAFVSNLDAKLHAEHSAKAEEWRNASKQAGAKLAELKATTGDAWDRIKIEMETVWHTISSALDKAELAKRTEEDNAKAPAASSAPAPAAAAPPPAEGATSV
jgi:undecaprenyl pyrophosphate synthase